MLLTVSVHRHGEIVAADSCKECVQNIPHAGHLSASETIIDNCPICQFPGTSFIPAVTIVTTSFFQSVFNLTGYRKQQHCSIPLLNNQSPRAPPFI